MSEIKRRGPYDKGKRRRKEILDKTLHVLAKRGVSKISLRVIAGEVGISHGTLMHYFPTLEDLLLETLMDTDRAGSQWLKEHPQRDLAEEIIRMAERNVSIPIHVATYTAMSALAAEEGNVTSREFFARRFATAREILVQAIRTGRPDLTREADIEAVASLVVAAFDGLQVQWLLDPSVDIAGSMAQLRPLLGAAQPIRDSIYSADYLDTAEATGHMSRSSEKEPAARTRRGGPTK